MDAIYIPQLIHFPDQTLSIAVSDYLPNFDTLTPVQGQIHVTHRGNYLEISAGAETIVTLTCDRCLQQYNHRLAVDKSELIWLEEPVQEPEVEGVEREILFDELVETLSPHGHFYPGEWLYEQLCLEIPQRQLCDRQCPGIEVQPQYSFPSIDSRWASLEALKGELSNN
jgi:uncharacterized protein